MLPDLPRVEVKSNQPETIYINIESKTTLRVNLEEEKETAQFEEGCEQQGLEGGRKVRRG